VNTLLKKRDIDSSDNAKFQKYLKDTFGIIKQGGKPIIYNTKIYNSKVEKINPTLLSDSINFQYNFKNDTLRVIPKQGTWVHAYFAFDTSNSVKFNASLNEGMGTANVVDKISVNGKILNTHIIKIFDRPVYKGAPITLSLSDNIHRYIIFGDEGIPSKRYIYQNGKVRWIPEK
jgi:hypothetical protein